MGDRKAFDEELLSPETRRVLMSSWKSLFKDPGLFLKSLWLMLSPEGYYEYRSKHVFNCKL
jgi:hypothetical protein